MMGLLVINHNQYRTEIHQLDLISLDDICDRIAEAENIKEVAKWCGCSYSMLWRYMHATPERENRMEIALSESSEALMQKARDVLEASLDKRANRDAQAAKALAEHYCRLAGYRNAKYSDKQNVAIQINNSNQPLALPVGLDPIAASKAYSQLIEGEFVRKS